MRADEDAERTGEMDVGPCDTVIGVAVGNECNDLVLPRVLAGTLAGTVSTGVRIGVAPHGVLHGYSRGHAGLRANHTRRAFDDSRFGSPVGFVCFQRAVGRPARARAAAAAPRRPLGAMGRRRR